jgi:hypothetical protein
MNELVETDPKDNRSTDYDREHTKHQAKGNSCDRSKMYVMLPRHLHRRCIGSTRRDTAAVGQQLAASHEQAGEFREL